MSYKRMRANHNIEDKDWELIAKSIYDEKTPETADNLSPDSEDNLQEKIGQLTGLTQKVDLFFELKKYNADQAWNKVESKIHNKSVKQETRQKMIWAHPIFRAAAAVLLGAVLLISGYMVAFDPLASGNLKEISATTEVLKTFTLPDGTLVSLNTNTKLKYPEKFGRKTREVSIEGEAFFEVKPNKNKPFIIHAGSAEIKVLGTSFNVSAYPETKQVEVIVETGKVQVLNKIIQTNELILTPGDKGTLIYSSNSLLKTTNQDPNFLAWKTHNLIFKATSLGEVIETLQKVYKVNIRLADSRLNGLLLSAQFNDNQLDFILKVIETTFQIESQQVNGQYILKAKS